MLGRAPGTLFAVAAETVTAGKFPVRLERFGRAFVKGQMLGELGDDTVNRDLDLRELWNQEDPFELAPNYLGAYRARLNANLAVMDGIDGKTDWPLQPDGTHPLTELYLGDYQVVDVAKPVRRGQLPRDRAGAAGGPGARDLRWPVAQRRRGRHEPHVRHHGRERPAHQRRGRPGDRARVGQLPLPGAAESRPGRRRQDPGPLQGRRPARLSPGSRFCASR